MWRRYGDVPYTLLVLGVFTLELLFLGGLTWTFSLRLGGLIPATRTEQVLIGTVASTAMAVLLLTAYILVYHMLSVPRERRDRERMVTWTERWIRVLAGEAPPPKVPLTRDALESALELREQLQGEEGRELSTLLERLEVGEVLGRMIRARQATKRLEGLDGLARARLPSAFRTLQTLIVDPAPTIRFMAARAAARTLASIVPGPDRDKSSTVLALALEASDLPPAAAGEVLLLLEEAAPAVLTLLFGIPQLSPGLLRAALDAVGRLGLTQFTDAAVVAVTHRDREVRAAGLRALGRLGRVPRRARDPLVIALTEDTEFVRIQAARAAAFLPKTVGVPLLYGTLGDRSWWVRRSSAEALLRMGPRGRAALHRAIRTHPDQFARDMSAQVLRDAWLEPTGATSELARMA
jgi:HEAT repeat protein